MTHDAGRCPADLRGCLDDWHSTVAVLHGGWCDGDGEDEPEHVHEDVPLSAFDLLSCIVSVPATLGTSLHALAVNDRSRRLKAPTFLLPNLPEGPLNFMAFRPGYQTKVLGSVMLGRVRKKTSERGLILAKSPTS